MPVAAFETVQIQHTSEISAFKQCLHI